MSISKKLAFVYCILILIFFCITLFLWYIYIKCGLILIEKENSLEHFNGIKRFIKLEEKNLEGLTKDWGAWDDAYNFILGKDPDFPQVNLTIETWMNNQLNLLVYTDKNGNIKSGGIWNGTGSRLQNVPAVWIKRILKGYFKLHSTINSHTGMTGIIIFDKKPWMISIFPVTTSDFKAPCVGFVLMGRILTQKKLKSIADLFGVKEIKILNLESFENNLKIPSSLKKHVTSSKEVNWQICGKYYEMAEIMENIFQNPVLVLFVKMFNRIGLIEKTFWILIFLQSGSFLLLGLLLYWFTENLVTRRLYKIVEHLKEIEKRKDILSLEDKGKDEISFLVSRLKSYTEIIHRQIKEIEETRKIYEIIANNSPMVIILFNEKAEIIYANPQAFKYFSKRGKPIHFLKNFVKRMLEICQKENSPNLKFCTKEGDHLLEIKISYIKYPSKMWLLLGYDVTAFKKEIEKLFERATKDFLTELYNRRFFEEQLKTVKSLVERGKTFSLLFIDLDDLKTINDKYGHIVGDEVLRAVAKAIRSSVRGSDFPARWGGDEFVILLEGDLNIAQKVAERIIKTLKNYIIKIGNEEIIPSVSIGITRIIKSLSPEFIIKKADEAAYIAKREGKGKIRIAENLS